MLRLLCSTLILVTLASGKNMKWQGYRRGSGNNQEQEEYYPCLRWSRQMKEEVHRDAQGGGDALFRAEQGGGGNIYWGGQQGDEDTYWSGKGGGDIYWYGVAITRDEQGGGGNRYGSDQKGDDDIYWGSDDTYWDARCTRRRWCHVRKQARK